MQAPKPLRDRECAARFGQESAQSQVRGQLGSDSVRLALFDALTCPSADSIRGQFDEPYPSLSLHPITLRSTSNRISAIVKLARPTALVLPSTMGVILMESRMRSLVMNCSGHSMHRMTIDGGGHRMRVDFTTIEQACSCRRHLIHGYIPGHSSIRYRSSTTLFDYLQAAMA